MFGNSLKSASIWKTSELHKDKAQHPVKGCFHNFIPAVFHYKRSFFLPPTSPQPYFRTQAKRENINDNLLSLKLKRQPIPEDKSLKRKGSGKDSIKSFSSCSTQYVFFFVCFSSSLKSWSESRITYWQETTLNTTLTVICTKIKHLFTWILKLRTRKIRNLGPLYPN